MLYEKYAKTISKIASVFKFVKRFRVAIIAVAAGVAATSSVTLGINGIVYDEVDCPAEIVYGQELSYEASAIFENVKYEYAQKGSNSWSSVRPTSVGDYKIRAVSVGAFGGKTYGDVHSFTIQPKEIEITIGQEEVEYGSLPVLSAELAEGDEITCSKFDYADVSSAETTVLPITEYIKITNSAGEDVTSSYRFTLSSSAITFTERTVGITVHDAVHIYDGTPFSFEEYEITSGSFVDGDIPHFEFGVSQTDVGTTANHTYITVSDSEGNDVTERYKFSYTFGDLIVRAREITVQTASMKWLYDGKAHEQTEYEIISDTKLVEGHTLKAVKTTSIKGVSTSENQVEYVVEDVNGKDVSANYKITYEYGSLEVEKRPLTVQTASGEWTYDGNAHENITLSVADSSVNPLAEGHQIVHYKDAYTDIELLQISQVIRLEDGSVGGKVNQLEAMILDEDGADVSENYALSYEYGILKILPKEYTVQFTDLTTVYDGQEYRLTDFSTVSGGCIAGEVPTITEFTTRTNVGETVSENKMLILKGEEQDMTGNYDFTVLQGKIKITARPITVYTQDATFTFDGKPHGLAQIASISGDGLVEGHTYKISETYTTVVYVSDGAVKNQFTVSVLGSDETTDLSGNYAIAYEYGYLKISPRPIYVTANTLSWMYDGYEHSADGFYTADGTGLFELENGLAEGHVATATVNGSIKTVAQNDARAWIQEDTFKIVDSKQEERTVNYAPIFQDGTLSITKRPITVQTGSGEWIYDGQMKQCLELWVSEETPNPLADGQDIKVAEDSECGATQVFWTEKGEIASYPNEIKCSIFVVGGEDTTENYEITYRYGGLLIKPRPITVQTEDLRNVYNGAEQSKIAFKVISELSIVKDEYHKIEAFTARKIVGTEKNILSLAIYTKRWGDEYNVTPNYEITYKYGEITITPRPITITTDSDEKTYDGTPLSCESYVLSTGENEGLAPSEREELKNWASITNAGTEKNTVELVILDKDGLPTKDNYTLTEDFGKLTVNKRELTIQTGSCYQMYDGQTWGRYVYDVISGSLAPDEYVYSETVPEICNVGKITNEWIDTEIYNQKDQKTTDNYEFTVKFGTLEIYARPITVQPYAEKIYDGTPLVFDGKNYRIGGEGLVENQSILSFVAVGERTDAGEGSCDLTSVEIGYSKTEKTTGNYDITYLTGTLTVSPRPLTIISGTAWKYYDGTALICHDHFISDETPLVFKHAVHYVAYLSEQTNANYGREGQEGTDNEIKNAVIWSAEDKDVSANYEISYEFGKLCVQYRPITITTAGYVGVYDGYEHDVSGYTITTPIENQPAIVQGQKPIVEVRYATVKNVIKDKNFVDRFNIVDERNEELSYFENYEITYEESILFIQPRGVQITSTGVEKVYDGVEVDVSAYEVLSLTDSDPIFAQTDTATISVKYQKAKDVIDAINTITVSIVDKNGDDMIEAGNYEVYLIENPVKITPREITIETPTESKVYDGTPLGAANLVIRKGTLAPNQKIVQNGINPTITNVGEIVNVIPYKIQDADENDVTGNYAITENFGMLKITPFIVQYKTFSAKKQFDGTPLIHDEIEFISEKQCVDGQILTFETTALLLPDTVDNLIVDFVVMSGEENVSANYIFECLEKGKLTVAPAPLELLTISYTWKYNGSTFWYKHVDIVSGEIHGFDFDIPYYTSIKDVGSKPNILTVRIIDDKKNDMTTGYDIVLNYGTLTVEPATDMPELPPPPITLPENDNGDLGGEITDSEYGEMRDTTLFKATANKNHRAYFRVNSFGDYAYSSWSKATPYTGETPVNPLYFTALALAYAKAEKVEISLSTNYSTLPYMLLNYAGYAGNTDKNDCQISTDSWLNYAVQAYQYEYDPNTVYSLAGTPYESAEVAYREFVQKTYLNLPQETKNELIRIANAKGITANTPDLISKIAEIVRNQVPYSVYTPEYKDDYALYFFTQAETGLCRYYATAAVAMYRAFGIPARYVTGYAENLSAGQETNISAIGHAWVEVYLDGMGWVIIDPTSSNNIDGGTDGGGDNPVDGEKPGDGEQDDEPPFKGQTIYVKPIDVWQVYNGETLYAKNEIDEAYGGIYLLLDEGYTYTVEVVGSRTDVGKTESQIISFTIFDPDGKEITPEELEIELVKETGLIRVVEDYVEVVICDISKVYDGKPLELEDFYYVENEEDLISSGYWVYVYLDREIINCSDSISLSELQQMDNLVRVYDNLGNDVTHSFEIVITGEALFVERQLLTITSGSATKNYDGKALTCSDYDIVGLVEGHTATIEVVGTITAHGETFNTILKNTLKVVDENGNDVTDNYRIGKVIEGKLTITT